MKKRVTIQDIADALGISRNTVSKAINNSDGLADGTREKILQKAVEMDYKQFSYVQALQGIQDVVKKRQEERIYRGEISLFTTIYLNPSHFASLMVDRLQQELSALGYTLNTHRVSPENLKNRTLPITFLPERTAGIICFEMFDWDYDRMICDLDIPVLFVDGPCKTKGRTLPADQLYMDNTSGIYRLVNSMLEAGKRRIGFIGNHLHCESFFERYMAYRGAMLLENEPVSEEFIINENHAEFMKPLLQELEELPDLFICANDFVAADAMQALRDLGKIVPDDVMIAGFDDSAESILIRPSLTTVHIHTQIMAYSAMHLLLSRIEDPSLDIRTVYTDTYLIWRESAPQGPAAQTE